MYTRLKDLREDKDKSQREIAEVLNIQQNVYSRYERGEREIPLHKVIELAKYYKVSLDYIAGLTNDKGGLHGTAGELSNYFELTEENKKHILKEIDFLIEQQCRAKETKSSYTKIS